MHAGNTHAEGDCQLTLVKAGDASVENDGVLEHRHFQPAHAREMLQRQVPFDSIRQLGVGGSIDG